MLAGLRVLAEDEMLKGILAVYGVSRGTHVPGGVVVGKEGFGGVEVSFLGSGMLWSRWAGTRRRWAAAGRLAGRSERCVVLEARGGCSVLALESR